MDSVINGRHCKAKCIINLQPNPTLLDTVDMVTLSDLMRPWTFICALENRPFLLAYVTYRVINGSEFCECSSSAGPYYLNQYYCVKIMKQPQMVCSVSTMYLIKYF